MLKNKNTLIVFFFLVSSTLFAQVIVRDTVYIYQKVVIKDTIYLPTESFTSLIANVKKPDTLETDTSIKIKNKNIINDLHSLGLGCYVTRYRLNGEKTSVTGIVIEYSKTIGANTKGYSYSRGISIGYAPEKIIKTSVFTFNDIIYLQQDRFSHFYVKNDFILTKKFHEKIHGKIGIRAGIQYVNYTQTQRHSPSTSGGIINENVNQILLPTLEHVVKLEYLFAKNLSLQLSYDYAWSLSYNPDDNTTSTLFQNPQIIWDGSSTWAVQLNYLF